ncbi:MAG: hypothetical protein ACHP7M_12555 [Burkholderiales bacterium]
MKLLAAALILLAAATSVSAKEKYHEAFKNAATQETFKQTADGIREEMQSGGKFEFTRPDERTTIEKKLADMAGLFEKDGSIEHMQQDTKIRLYNDQESVNAILTKRDSDRVICENRMPVGSHIPKTTCHTYGQAEEARRETIRQTTAWDNLGCVGGSALGREKFPCMPGTPGSASGP